MSDKKTSKKKGKCSTNCKTCEFYDKPTDFCEAKMLKNCSKQKNANFSNCEDYLVREDLVMY